MLFRTVYGMRHTAYGWSLVALFLSIVASGQASAEPELVDRIVAIIDREVIVLSEAEQAMWLVELRTDEDAGLRDVVERLIEARLIEHEVARFTDAPVPDERGPTLEEIDQVRRILEEQRFNERVDQWIDGLKRVIVS